MSIKIYLDLNYSLYFYRLRRFSLIFMAVTIPVGLLAMFLGSRFGLRSSMMIAGWTNGVGALIRLLSSAPFIPEHLRFPIGIAGQAIAACAYPFIMFM